MDLAPSKSTGRELSTEPCLLNTLLEQELSLFLYLSNVFWSECTFRVWGICRSAETGWSPLQTQGVGKVKSFYTRVLDTFLAEPNLKD